MFGLFCSQRCADDWVEKFADKAIDHFGRTTEPKRVLCDEQLCGLMAQTAKIAVLKRCVFFLTSLIWGRKKNDVRKKTVLPSIFFKHPKIRKTLASGDIPEIIVVTGEISVTYETC